LEPIVGSPRMAFSAAPSTAPSAQQAWSPSGRCHPDRARAAELRHADLSCDVNFFASSRAVLAKGPALGALVSSFTPGMAAGPSGDVNLPSAMPTDTQSWIANQSWLESLRYYPTADDPFGNLTGKTHGRMERPSDMEAGVRVRVGVAELDPLFKPERIEQSFLAQRGEAFARRLNEGIQRLLGAAQADAQAVPAPGTTPSMGWCSEEGECMFGLMPPSVGGTEREEQGALVVARGVPLPSSRPRPDPARLVALATPKPRQSQECHLHDWEVRARRQSIYVAHDPDYRRRASAPAELAIRRRRSSRSASSEKKAPLLEVTL